jgi:hypothetical protein
LKTEPEESIVQVYFDESVVVAEDVLVVPGIESRPVSEATLEVLDGDVVLARFRARLSDESSPSDLVVPDEQRNNVSEIGDK